MEEANKIINQILPRITPTTKDKKSIKKTIDIFSGLVQQELKRKKVDARIELVGSIAKDTYLKDSLDIDVFLLFDPKKKRNQIAKTTQTIGKNLLENTEECYAEHPYIRGIFQQYKIELVPGYLIQDATEKISAVDRTPLHTKYIQKNISNQQKQEIRLFKQFLHGINCYGAEAEIQGFSGYLCEILIIKFHSYLELLNKAQTWKSPIFLSLHNEPTDTFTDPLIFIDPVDTKRNVASAVSEKTFNRFIRASQAFLEKPKTTFFFPNPVKPWTLIKIKKQITNPTLQFIGIIFSKPDLISENLIPQIRRTCRFIKKESQQNDFTIYDIDFTIDQTNQLIYLIIQADRTPLSETFTHEGPPISLTTHKKKFLEKWKDHPLLVSKPYKKNNRLFVTVKRTNRNFVPFLLENLPNYPFGRHIKKEIKKQFLILKETELAIKELQEFWTTYFDGKEPWER